LELERQMHEGFTPWVAEHVKRSEGLIVDTGYNPDKFPSQRIDMPKTPALADSSRSPERVLGELGNHYAQIMNGWSKARLQISAFRTAPAYEDSYESLAEVVANHLEDGKHIGLLTDHAEDLFDMAKGLGGLSLAIAASRGTKYLSSFNTWVNKLMTRQYYHQISHNAITGDRVEKDIALPYLLSVGGGVRWVIPDTENSQAYIPDGAIREVVNRGALTSFAQDKKAGKGTVEVLVPAGTQMRAKAGSDGMNKYLIAPGMSESTANLLAHLDAIVVFSSWAGRISISKLVEIKPAPEKSKSERKNQIALQIRELLRQQTQLNSGLRVVFAEEVDSAA
jgi:hypothetical protein